MRLLAERRDMSAMRRPPVLTRRWRIQRDRGSRAAMRVLAASQSEPNSTLGSSRFPHAYPPLTRCFRADDSGLRVAQPSNRQWSKGDWA
jgi:hypothetical protein